MKVALVFATLFAWNHGALGSAGPSSPGIPVECEFNAKYVKVAGKDKPNIDLRIVSMPTLKLSGTAVTLEPAGTTSQCRQLYSGKINETTYVGTCDDHGIVEPLVMENVELMIIDPSDKSRTDYECKRKKSVENKSGGSTGIK